MSDPQQTIETLRRFNQWRRGDESIEQPDPTEIGVAIDNAINLIKQRDTLAEACRKLMKVVGAPDTNEWQEIEECDAAYLTGKQALTAVKGYSHE